MLFRLSNKSLLYIFTALLLIVLSACVTSVMQPSAPIPATTIVQPTSVQTPTQAIDLATQKQKNFG